MWGNWCYRLRLLAWQDRGPFQAKMSFQQAHRIGEAKARNWDIDEEVASFKTHNHIILKLFSTENKKVKPKVSQGNAEFYVILQC